MIKNNKEINWKNILVLILVFILGFGAGMLVTFETVIDKLFKYNIIK